MAKIYRPSRSTTSYQGVKSGGQGQTRPPWCGGCALFILDTSHPKIILTLPYGSSTDWSTAPLSAVPIGKDFCMIMTAAVETRTPTLSTSAESESASSGNLQSQPTAISTNISQYLLVLLGSNHCINPYLVVSNLHA